MRNLVLYLGFSAIFCHIINCQEIADSDVGALPAEARLQDDNVWIPDLRGIPIGRYGETVAEFSVGTSALPKSDEDKPNDDASDTNKVKRKVVVSIDGQEPEANKKNRVAKPTFACTDPQASIQLHGENQSGVTLTESSPRVGLFGLTFTRVHVKGRCCWELFDRVGYTGELLRVCPGKYSASDLPTFSGKLRSLRPLDYLKFKLYGG